MWFSIILVRPSPAALNKQGGGGIIVGKINVDQSSSRGVCKGYSMSGHIQLHCIREEEDYHSCRLRLNYYHPGDLV